ncbi:MAG: hypothetical protein A2428_18000 [Bdellovibrionales bacterium RIFOXYC1_FULL_54_43]|nr:MAG: hypothetical protein A2428_18000 [Bdellovibrionales bacterium RIFOXYC1_FULL_54_43]OFZ79715.1 MAG: hypothetical protein A2603_06190 [Bdellovibrionales bacterium RIFOXYD1_FULL_55_31]
MQPKEIVRRVSTFNEATDFRKHGRRSVVLNQAAKELALTHTHKVRHSYYRTLFFEMMAFLASVQLEGVRV